MPVIGRKYFNWDNSDDRRVILSGPTNLARASDIGGINPKPPTVVFDELHKHVKWKSLIDLVNQLQKMSEEIASLRGQVEALNYELETAKKRQQDFYVDLDTRLRKLEPQSAASTAGSPEGGQTAAKPAGDPAAESQAYEAALNHFKAGRYKEASWGFSAFVQKYPDSDLAPNAQFWLGNAFYAQRDCRKAIEVQSILTSKWPTSSKAADAYVAIAACQQEMGNPAAAKRSLEAVIAKYPD